MIFMTQPVYVSEKKKILPEKQINILSSFLEP